MDVDRISFGNKNQPFYELSPLYRSDFVLLNRSWNSLMHFWVVNSLEDIDTQIELRKIKSLSKLIRAAGRYGVIDFSRIDKTLLLESIYEAFSQDKERGMVLLSTGSSELIYNAPKSFLTDGNRYGKLLMRMRYILAEDGSI